jgi:hypothetical protein
MELKNIFNTRKKRLVTLVILIVFLFGMVAASLVLFKEAEASWYDDAYGYRKQITFTHNADINEDRRVSITVDTQTLISSNKMQADCDDTRFTDANGKILRYQLVSGCNSASTQYDVVYPSIINGTNASYVYYGNPAALSGSEDVSLIPSLSPSGGSPSVGNEEKGPSPVLYLKFDEGYGNTAYDSSSNANNSMLGGTYESTPTSGTSSKIDDAGDPGYLPGSGRQVVRTSSGTLYAVIYDSGYCEVWKSSSGASWTEQDNSNKPTCGSVGIAIAIDSSDIIHILYAITPTVKYVTFTTSSDTWGTPENVWSTPDDAYADDITIDSYDIPHVVMRGDEFQGSYYDNWVMYANRIGGSWSTLQVQYLSNLNNGTFSKPSITMNEDDTAEIAYQHVINSDLVAAVANARDPISFDYQTVDSDIDHTAGSTSIAVDSSGNTWIAYVDENGATDYVTLVEHVDTDSWSTWQTPVTNSDAGSEPSLVISATDKYVLYQNGSTNIAYNKYDGSWDTESTVEPGTYQDAKGRWSYLNNISYTTYGIDYLFSDGTDISYNNLTLGATAGAPTWKTSEACLSGNCLYYDGTDDASIATNSASIDFDEQLAGEFTISTWIRANSDGENNVGEIFNKGTNTYARVTNEGSDGLADLEVKIDLTGTDESVTFADAITLNRWQQIAITYTDDGDDEASVYIDGLPKTPTTDANASGSPETDANDLLIGGSESANFHGFIDNFKIYKTERSEAEVKSDFMKLSGTRGASTAFGDDKSFLSDGLIGYWKMDESSGTNVADSSGNANNGTATDNDGGNGDGDTPPIATGSAKFGYSRQFDGTDDYINIGSSETYIRANEPFTVSTWTNIDFNTNAIQNVLQLKSDATEPWHLILSNQDGAWNYKGVSIGNHADFTHIKTDTDESLLTNGWHHVVVVYNGQGPQTISNYKIYLDTSPLTLSQSSDYDTGWPQNSYMGVAYKTGSAYNRLDGMADEVRIYNRVLSPAEVQVLYIWAPGPVGYWKMDEGTGTTTTYDHSGNNYNGNLNSITQDSWVIGRFGSGLSFDGSSDYVEIADQPELRTENFTISFWQYLPNSIPSSDQYPIAKADDKHFVIGIQNSATNYELSVWDSSLVEHKAGFAKTNLTANRWEHIAAVRDTTNSKTYIYLNGVLMDEQSQSFTPNLGTAAMRFGKRIDGISPFSGYLDDVKIYNYARTQEQIIEDMNGGHPAPGSPVGSPIGYWKFDEGYGDTAYDSSPQGNDGNLYGTCPGAGTCPSWTNSGKIGKALSFDGGDYLQVSADSSLNLVNNGDYTVSAWLYPDWSSEADNAIAITYEDGGGTGRTLMTIDLDDDDCPGSNKINNYLGANWNCGNTSIQNQTWTYVTLVVTENGTSDEVKWYINGIEDGTSTTNSTTNDNANIRMGSYKGSVVETFEGIIDEVKIYNFALTADQIKTEYNQGGAQVFGSKSTDSSGNPSWSATDEYCPPGQGSSCIPPVAEWKLDEKSGQTANDTSENNNSGTLGSTSGIDTNDPSWQTSGLCKYGSCLKFDNSDDYIFSAYSSTLSNLTNDFTVSAWINNSSLSGTDSIAGHSRDNSENGWRLATNDTGLRLTTWGVNAYDSTSISLPTNSWHYVTAVLDSSNDVSFYVDGVYKETVSYTSPATADTNDIFLIGSQQNSDSSIVNPFDGYIDQVRIYNYARTPAQIAWEYNRGGPVGWWKMDDNVSGDSKTVYDSSGNGNNGTTHYGANTTGMDCTVAGKRNLACDFDGSDDWIEIPDSDYLDFGTGDFSYSLWVNTSQDCSSSRVWFAQRNQSTSRPSTYIGCDDTNKIVTEALDSNDQGGNNISTTIGNDGNWHQAVLVKEGHSSATLKLYVDGKLEDSDPFTFTGNFDYNSGGIEPNSIGRFNVSPYYYTDGKIDDVRIYNYALTPQQVKNDYNEGSLRFGPDEGSP